MYHHNENDGFVDVERSTLEYPIILEQMPLTDEEESKFDIIPLRHYTLRASDETSCNNSSCTKVRSSFESLSDFDDHVIILEHQISQSIVNINAVFEYEDIMETIKVCNIEHMTNCIQQLVEQTEDAFNQNILGWKTLLTRLERSKYLERLFSSLVKTIVSKMKNLINEINEMVPCILEAIALEELYGDTERTSSKWKDIRSMRSKIIQLEDFINEILNKSLEIKTEISRQLQRGLPSGKQFSNIDMSKQNPQQRKNKSKMGRIYRSVTKFLFQRARTEQNGI